MAEKDEYVDAAIALEEEAASGSEPSQLNMPGTQPQLTLPDTDSKPRPRSPSPSGPIVLDFLLDTQMNRLTILESLAQQSQQLNSDQLTLDDVIGHLKVLDGQWQQFNIDHNKIGVTCKRSTFNHPYITQKCFNRAFFAFNTALSNLTPHQARLNERLALTNQPVTRPPPQHVNSSPRLPQLNIQQFTGEYADWPAFQDLFNSLVRNNVQLTAVEKMQYLKTSLKGPASQLISHVPLTAASFESAWNTLCSRYQNKRLLVSSYLDKITGDNSQVKCNSTQLNSLLTTVTEAMDALKVQGLPVEHWDAMLVHQLTKRFDHQLISAWENEIGRSSEIPTFAQLKDFLWGKARAQERIESAHPTKPVSTQRPASMQPNSYHTNRNNNQARTHTVSTTTKQLTHHYPCDQCGGDHYVVACAAFRALTPVMRRNLVVKSRLCFNCLGHHDVAQCKSTRTCSTCQKRHHTMIHIGTTQSPVAQLPAASTSTQPSTSE